MRNKSTERKRKLASKTLLSETNNKDISHTQVPHETLSLIEMTHTNEVRIRQLTDYLSPKTTVTEKRMLEEQWESDKEDRIRPYS